MTSIYRVYIRFGETNCVRFWAPGEGDTAGDGLQLFEWIRNPSNIARLRNGLQYAYEIDHKDIGSFLEFKLLEDRGYMEKQMNKYSNGRDMLEASKQKWTQFHDLHTGVDKLEAISNANEITVIPRVAPRKRSDQSGWLYSLNLDQETLEVYEFVDNRPYGPPPFARLKIKSLYKKSPNKPPGYYIKLKLSELQLMWKNQWITLHEDHAEVLRKLWKQNKAVLQTVPHADSVPFAVLYGSVFDGYDGDGSNPSQSEGIIKAKLTETLAAQNTRQPSKMPITERARIRPRNSAAGDRWLRKQARRLQARKENRELTKKSS
ncbi:hypothetical protein GGR58DRAFT_260299 [Xylaria digitata]|nr:hypothetical protein GGR58DRAFT_260299 [Xylaria digitata]